MPSHGKMARCLLHESLWLCLT